MGITEILSPTSERDNLFYGWPVFSSVAYIPMLLASSRRSVSQGAVQLFATMLLRMSKVRADSVSNGEQKNPKLKLVKDFGQWWRQVILTEVNTALFDYWTYFTYYLTQLMWNNKKSVSRIVVNHGRINDWISVEKKGSVLFLPSNQVKHWHY